MALIFNHYVATSTVIFSNTPLSANDMARRLEGVAGTYPFYVSTDTDGNVTGYCYAHRWMPDEVYGHTLEITIYLHHQALGQGIGGRLLQSVIDSCRRAGCYHRLVSFITHGNIPCEQMHLRAGFRLMGVLPEVGYKFNQYLNDAVYLLDL